MFRQICAPRSMIRLAAQVLRLTTATAERLPERRKQARTLGMLLVIMPVAATLLMAGIARGQPYAVELISQPGDYIGGGQTLLTTNASDFSLSGTPAEIHVSSFYDIYFSGPGGAALTVGTYANATRWPFNGISPGISISGDGRGCNTDCGSFQILEIHTAASGNVDRFWVKFTQYCECFMAPMSGEIRYNSQLAPTVIGAAPTITTQPADQTGYLGGSVTFAVITGSAPLLSYQWSFNGSPVNAAINASLTLNSVRFDQAGHYIVLISNPGGSVLSSSALLTVNPAPPCATPPAGLISWWRGEVNALDSVGNNNGTLAGNTAYAPAVVGQGFVLDGNVGSAVQVGNPASLQLQNFTIEAWIQRASTTGVGSSGDAALFGYGSGGYVLGINGSGTLFLGNVGNSVVYASTGITDTGFHHVAVTKSGTSVVFYIDGVAYAAPAYSTAFNFGTPAAIGARGDNLSGSFLGIIDELSIYSRALNASEIQSIYAANLSGKCASVPPVITSQPANQAAASGDTVTFSVITGGTPPLSYQWSFNGANIDGATNAQLVVANVQTAQEGIYTVLVNNSLGSVLSSNAVLTVNRLPPAISTEPASQTVFTGATVGFSVAASGTPPLSYQWSFNGTGLDGATNASLTLVNVQPAQAGTYAVLVSNASGSATSSEALLTVNPAPPCALAPADLVSWWAAEGNALDSAGTNNGALVGNTAYAPETVGQGFVMDGNSDAVRVGNPATLQLQNFTIETWVKRGRTTIVSLGAADADFFAYGSSGYAFGIHFNGTLFLGKVNSSSVISSASITDTSFHHVAVTKSGTTVVFYIDGTAFAAPALSGTFNFTTPAAIGARGDILSNSFLGMIDELSIYSRALSASEIQSIYTANVSGKCPLPPVIVSQPQSLQAFQGNTVTFSASATGSSPLSYQWSFNGSNVDGATNASLTLNNVQLDQAGTYAVMVINLAGSVLSSNAVLTVNPPPACALPPAGLVGWWRGEGNALDSAGANNGSLAGNTAYAPGMVGQGFVLDGSGDAVQVGNPASLQLQDFTIEAWIQRSSAAGVSSGSSDADFFGYGSGGYGFGIHNNGTLYLGTVNLDSVNASTGITDTSFHHVAVTKSGTSVVFYIDGSAFAAPAFSTTFTFVTPAALGARGDNLAGSFLGIIDELSIYSRALTPSEIQSIYAANVSGKCLGAAPVIKSQPTDQTAFVGDPPMMSVTAAGTPPFNYQWSFNGTSLDGATNPVLTLNNVQLGQAGSYSVLVANAFGSVLSSNAVLTVDILPPAITFQPISQVVFAGDPVSFIVTASGSPPLSYQWSFNGTNIDGATNAVLTLNNVQLNQAGSYSVLVSNVGGSAPSSNALLTVNPPPPCEPPPAGLVSWWRGEGNASDALGANNGTLAGNTTYARGMVGQGFVLDGSGDAVQVGNSPSLQLQDFTIETWVKRASATLVSASGSDADLFGYGGGYAFGISSGGTLFLTKVAVDAVYASASITDTNFHHVAVTKSGTTVVFYVDGLEYPAPAYGSTFVFTTQAAIGAQGDTLAGGFLGMIDELSFYSRALTAPEIQSLLNASVSGKCPDMPPTITTQPTDQTVLAGDTVIFDAVAAGMPPLSYHWSLDGTNIAGATETVLTLPNVQPAQAGVYTLLVGNAFGSVLSSNAVLTVNATPPTITSQPAGQTVFVGTTVSFSVAASSTTPLSYQWILNGTNIDGATNAVLTLNDVQLDQAGNYSVLVANLGGSVPSSNALLTVDLPPPCAPPRVGLVSWWRAEGNTLDSSGNNNGTLVGNTTYVPGMVGQCFVLDGSGDAVQVGSPASLQLQDFTIEAWIRRASTAGVGYSGSDAAFFGYGSGGYVFGINSGGTLFMGNVDSSAVFANASVTDTSFHHVAVTKSGSSVVFYIDGVAHAAPAYSTTFSFGTPAAIGARGDSLAGSFLGMIDELSIYSRAVTTSELQSIYNAGVSGKCVNIPAVIDTQPTDQTVFANDPVTFKVSAAGTHPLSYQWSFNGINIDGATNPQLTLTKVQPVQAGAYAVLVSNAFGSVLSSNAVLTVNAIPPTITSQPVSQTVFAGATASFSVAASGTLPLSYQWRFNGANLDGSTNAVLTLNNVQLDQAGNYSVLVTNLGGSVPSSSALLTVNPRPSCALLIDMVSWWRAEGNASDSAGNNHGTLAGNTTYAPGMVGQGFVLDGSRDAVQVGNPASLQLQDFTIEAWIKRASTAGVGNSGGDAALFGYGSGGYVFGLNSDGTLFLGNVDNSAVYASTSITDTGFHHVAVTKSGTSVVFYIDGVAHAAPAYSTTFSFAAPAAIGARGDNLAGSFLGMIDELSIYGRALDAFEIQTIYYLANLGKCVSVPPVIRSQPVSQTAIVGTTATFRIAAAGTSPLGYQWTFNETNIDGATNDLLTLNDVRFEQAGSYAVLVTNVLGSILSSSAVLTVVPPPPCAIPPLGLVSWWRGEGDAMDVLGNNSGTLAGNTTYATCMVGQGFVFDGDGDAVQVGNPANLRLQNFTIEAWIKRASTAGVGHSGGDATLFGYGSGGFVFGINNSGTLFLGDVDLDGVYANSSITDMDFHHVAVTKSGTSVVFYVDGAADPAPAYTTTFSFTTPAAIGARGDSLENSFLGMIDELSIYSRALTTSEIQSLYAANLSGKCATGVPPYIASQPTSQTVMVGATASFNVAASGWSPLSYQWSFNGTNLDRATNAVLTLSNVQAAQAGTYAVLVTNAFGSMLSSNAVLTVTPAPPCATPPEGLVSWWRGEGNALDAVGNNNGTLAGNTTYAPGVVGRGFVLDGNGDAVQLGNPVSLLLQNFTIEAWIKRASATGVGSGGDAAFFGHGAGGSVFGINSSGTLFLGTVDYSVVFAGTSITDTNFHHVAVTKSGTSVVFYTDGVAYPAPAYATSFSYGTPAAIGARGDNLTGSFLGMIDELSIYNRALTTSEIQSLYVANFTGKCSPGTPPVISSQPLSQTVLAGATVSFSVAASGGSPLSYQWSFNGTKLDRATNTVLTLSVVQVAQSGAYTVRVANAFGSVLSSDAVLIVTPPSPCVPPPAGLVSWWEGDGNALDSAGTNNGTLAGDTGYAPGMVGQGFALDGSGDAVEVGNPTSLQLQNFTIEAWIMRASTTGVGSDGDAAFFGYGADGYVFGINSSGAIYLSAVGVDSVTASTSITDTNFHHVAVTKSGTTVVFYIDGVAYAAPAYTTTFSFTTPAAIGARGDNLKGSFLGRIDELSIYSRALPDSEIQSIYHTGISGKCPLPPEIVSQPQSQQADQGSAVTFSIVTTGTLPLSYQWRLNGVNIPGATAGSLTLASVQPTQAGAYTVLVTNSAGSVLSHDAVLTINLPPPCATLPAGLVSWWQGEGNALDSGGNNNGTPAGNTTYAPGMVGQGFVLGGDGDAVQVGNPASLQLQNFTIEAWIQRASTTDVTYSGVDAALFGYGSGGYVFGIAGSGNLFLGSVEVDSVAEEATSITDTNFHHVAVTKSGTSVVFYVDGVAYAAPAYGTTFSFTTPAAIGARGDDLSAGFLGAIDELSIYNRALSSSEIQSIYAVGSSGKCPPTGPTITTQPGRQLVLAGCNATFSVVADGTEPLSYQWWKGSLALAAQTNSSLVLTGVLVSDFGTNYHVIVTNPYGSATSSDAMLSLNHPPVTGPDTIQRFAWGGTRVNAADLLANDTDADGDTLVVVAVSSISVAGGTVNLQDNWIYYLPPAGSANTDTFTYTASDGHCGGTAQGTVTVQIKMDSSLFVNAEVQQLGDGSYRLSFGGAPGGKARIQYTDSLSAPNWQDLATGTADNYGVFRYVDSPPPNAPARFYRSLWTW